MYGNFQWADKFAKSFVIFTPGIFLFSSPNFNVFSKLMWILQSRIKSNPFVKIGRCTNYLQMLYQRELVTSDCFFFVIRNNSGVQIFRNDEKARQRHLPKMYTLVVTMNWHRIRNIFRIRFRIFYNRSELSRCVLKESNMYSTAWDPLIVHGTTSNYVRAKFGIVHVVQSMLFNFLISLTNKIGVGASYCLWLGSHFEFQMAAVFCPFLGVVVPKTHSFVCPDHLTSYFCHNVFIQLST